MQPVSEQKSEFETEEQDRLMVDPADLWRAVGARPPRIGCAEELLENQVQVIRVGCYH